MRNVGIYLSGSISHDPDFVRKFGLAERLIRETVPEAVIFNPAAHQDLPAGDKTEEEIWASYLLRDLLALFQIRRKANFAVVVSLPGHERSRGASLERLFADKLGFRVLDIQTIFPDWDRLLAEELGGRK